MELLIWHFSSMLNWSNCGNTNVIHRIFLHYDLSVDYATKLWNEFVKSIGNTNAIHGILYSQYWSLILQYVYKKENIMVPENEEKAEISMYHYPTTVGDSPEEFPIVARIPDAMLRKVNPANPVLVAYLQTINPCIQIRVALVKSTEGLLKKYRGSKKNDQASPSKPSLVSGEK